MRRLTVAFASLVFLIHWQPADSAAAPVEDAILLEATPEDAEEAVEATKKWGQKAYSTLNRRQLVFLLKDKEDQHKRLIRLLQVLVIAGYVLAAMTFFYEEGRQIAAKLFDLPKPETTKDKVNSLRRKVAELEKRLMMSIEKGESSAKRETELKALATSETIQLEEQVRLLKEEIKEKDERYQKEKEYLNDVIFRLAEEKLQKLDEIEEQKRAAQSRKSGKSKHKGDKTDKTKSDKTPKDTLQEYSSPQSARESTLPGDGTLKRQGKHKGEKEKGESKGSSSDTSSVEDLALPAASTGASGASEASSSGEQTPTPVQKAETPSPKAGEAAASAAAAGSAEESSSGISTPADSNTQGSQSGPGKPGKIIFSLWGRQKGGSKKD